MPYELWYWDGIPGRGEFVRLALEAGRIPYTEPPRERDGLLGPDLAAERMHPPFAPPYLKAGELVIGQTANILLFLGEHHGLAPDDVAGRLWVNQLQLTIADWVVEAHDVHHPISGSLYYEDQKPEALRRAESFRTERLPKFLDYFSTALTRNKPFLAGVSWSYADLSLFQVIEGLQHAFPRRMATLAPKHARILEVHSRMAELPGIRDYLQSPRRLPFGNGIFRHYPELDAD
ncbi:MAG: glutathione S-transferase [Janthinobacterium lividum]